MSNDHLAFYCDDRGPRELFRDNCSFKNDTKKFSRNLRKTQILQIDSPSFPSFKTAMHWLKRMTNTIRIQSIFIFTKFLRCRHVLGFSVLICACARRLVAKKFNFWAMDGAAQPTGKWPLPPLKSGCERHLTNIKSNWSRWWLRYCHKLLRSF